MTINSTGDTDPAFTLKHADVLCAKTIFSLIMVNRPPLLCSSSSLSCLTVTYPGTEKFFPGLRNVSWRHIISYLYAFN